MESAKILQSDILDIIFENRNKAYGAYSLRKGYDNRMFQSLMIMMSMVALMALLITRKNDEKIKKLPVAMETVLYKMAKPANPEPKKQEIKKAPATAKKMNTQTFVSHLSIVNNRDSATKLIKNLDSAVIASQTIAGPAGIKPLVQQPLMISFPSTGVVKEGNGKKPEVIEQFAEVMPGFPGGPAALRNFLSKNLTAPSEISTGDLIEVDVQFIVGFDGKLKGFNVVKDGGKEFNDEVIRVLKKMPDWIPGKTKGENVSVYFTLPVKFIGE